MMTEQLFFLSLLSSHVFICRQIAGLFPLLFQSLSLPPSYSIAMWIKFGLFSIFWVGLFSLGFPVLKFIRLSLELQILSPCLYAFLEQD